MHFTNAIVSKLRQFVSTNPPYSREPMKIDFKAIFEYVSMDLLKLCMDGSRVETDQLSLQLRRGRPR